MNFDRRLIGSTRTPLARRPATAVAVARRAARVALAIAVAAGCLAGPAALAQSPNPDSLGLVWNGESVGFLKQSLFTGGNVTGLLVPVSNVSTLAVDEQRSVLWVYGAPKLYCYGYDQHLILSVTVPNAASPGWLAVNGNDGSVWVGSGKNLSSYNTGGQLLRSVTLSTSLIGMGLDSTNSVVWVGFPTTVSSYDAISGAHLADLTDLAKARVTAITAKPGSLFVATSAAIRQYLSGAGGAATFLRSYAIAAATPIDWAANYLWAASGQTMYSVNTTTSTVTSFTYSLFGRSAVAAVAATNDQSAVFSAGSHTAVFGPSGGTGWDAAQGALALAISNRETTPPQLAFASPANGAYVDVASPTLSFTYSDAGSGVALNSLYGTGFQGGTSIPLALSCTGGTTSATCSMAAVLPQGPVQLTANVQDYARNTTTTSITIVVDTTPPALAITSPANGATITQAQPTIALSFSDAGSGVDTSSLAITANGTALPVTCTFTASTASCQPNAGLPPGNVTLAATIRDHAGNAATAQVTVTTGPDAAPPALAFLAPKAGALIAVARPLLSLSYSDAGADADPTSLAVTANGSALAVSCTSQGTASAGTLACRPQQDLPIGAVTLAATLRDLAGNTGSASVGISVIPATTTITGKVVGAGGSAVGGAAVYVFNRPSLGTVSAADGSFSIANVNVAANQPLGVVARSGAGETALVGSTFQLTAGGSGTTSAGTITITPLCGAVFGDEFRVQALNNGGAAPAVNALAVFDDGTGPALYVGGAFISAGGQTAYGIAKWDGVNWSPLASAGLLGTVQALAVYDDGSGAALYAGGQFQYIGDSSLQVNNLARWNGHSWSAVGGGTSGTVSALQVFDDGRGPALYVGGTFQQVGGGGVVNNVARWNGQAWSALAGGTSAGVQTFGVFDDGRGPALYVGGSFQTAGSVTVNQIARWDGTAWSSLGGGLNNPAFSMVVFDDGTGPALYVGGDFSQAGGVGAARIARWNGTTWSAVAGAGTDPSQFLVYAFSLAVHDDGTGPALYAGGEQNPLGSAFIKWDGHSWSGVGGGILPTGGANYAPVYALAEWDEHGLGFPFRLSIGGAFTQAAQWPSYELATWYRTCSPPDRTPPAILLTAPPVDSVTSQSTVTLAGSLSKAAQLTANGQAVTVQSNLAFSWSPSTLASGLNVFHLVATDAKGNVGTLDVQVVRDQVAPTIAFVAPAAGSTVHVATPQLTLAYGDNVGVDPSTLSIQRSGSPVAVSCAAGSAQAVCTPAAPLPVGATTLSATIKDRAGNLSAAAQVSFTIDTTTPPPQTTVKGTVQLVGGAAAAGAQVTVLGQAGLAAVAQADGSFTIAGVSAAPASLTVVARQSGAGGSLLGAATGLVPVAGGVTTAGAIVLRPLCAPVFDDSFQQEVGVDANYPPQSAQPQVSAMAVFDDGTGPALYVGGQFAQAGGRPANNVAKWDGTKWSPVGATAQLPGGGVDSKVQAMTVWNGALYVGGWFQYAGGVAVSGIAKWDGHAWSQLAGGVNGKVGDTAVYSLAVFNNVLYVGGRFAGAGPVGKTISAINVASWNGTAWSALGGGLGLSSSGDLVDSTVYALAVYNSPKGTSQSLYAGGNFLVSGSTQVNHLAVWSGSSWSAVGGGVGPTASSSEYAYGVYSMAVWNGSLYVGGVFTSTGPNTTSGYGGIARWNNKAWSQVGSGISVDFFSGIVDAEGFQALSVYDDGTGAALYAMGSIVLGTTNQTFPTIVKFDGTSWTAVGGGFPAIGYGGMALASFSPGPSVPARLFAGTTAFETARGTGIRGIASWDGKAWSPLGAGVASIAGALAVFKDQLGPALYAGSSSNPLRWDGTAFTEAGNVVGGPVQTLATLDLGTGPRLYAGGTFVTAGPWQANGIAAWDGASWSPLGAGFDDGSGAQQVLALAVFDDGTGKALYAAGSLATADGVAVNNIAKWTGASWVPLQGGVNGYVQSLAVFDDGSGPALYVAGTLTEAGGNPVNNVAKWNGKAWLPVPSGFPGNVSLLTVFDDGSGPALYLAGSFTQAGGQPASFIARWNGKTWSSLAGGLGGTPTALAAFDDGTGMALYAVGTFATAGGQAANGVAKWDGKAWSAVGSDISRPASSSGVTWSGPASAAGFDDGNGPALYVGGLFVRATQLSSPNLVTYLARLKRPLLCPPNSTPTLSFTAPAPGSYAGSSTPEIDLAWSDPGGDVSTSTLAITRGGAAMPVSCVFGAAAAQCKPTSPLPDGSVQLSATIADLTGNVSPAATLGFTIDSQPPAFAFTLPANGAVLAASTAEVKAHYSDAGSGIDPTTLSLTLSATVAAGFQCSYDASDADCTPAAPLGDGTYTFYGTVRDRAGNSSPQAQVTFTVDTLPPQLAITAPAAGSSTNQQSPQIVFTYSDAGTGVDTSTLAVTANGSPLPLACSFGPASATCTPVSPLAAGTVALSATVKDHAGHTSAAAADSFSIVLDFTPPTITVSAPVPGSATNQPSQTISGSLSKPAALTVNGAAAAVGSNNAFSYGPVTLSEGANSFLLVATDSVGNTAQLQLAVLLDTVPPALAITAPAAGATFDASVTPIQVSWSDAGSGVNAGSLVLTANGSALAVTCSTSVSGASCTAKAPLAGGAVTLAAQVSDRAGNTAAAAQVSFTAPGGSTGPHPVITVTSPAPNSVTNNAAPVLSGRLSEPATLTLNGAAVTVASDLSWSAGPLSLSPGSNSFTLVATDGAGNVSQLVFTLTLDAAVPAPVNASLVSVTAGAAGQVTVAGAAGAVPVGEPGLVAVVADASLTGETTAPVAGDGSFSAQVAALPGDTLLLSVRNPGGNQSTVVSLQVSGTPPAPPDPAAVAPLPDPTAATNLCARTAFLWSGANPVQFGVAAGAIDCRRVSVVRGRALDRTGAPIAGVRVSADGHPELGSTYTRADGRFDLAVNGGGDLVLRYARSGYLKLQRRLQPAWGSFVAAPDVVLTPPDAQVTAIDLTSSTPVQVARGTKASDGAGTRQATLLFAQGTTAAMVLPGGARQPLTSLAVRATDYSAGNAGPSCLPAALPANLDFTWAADLTVDQAEAAGATSVEFSQPVPLYVENFLHFALGQAVPAAYFDRQQGVWVPSANGRVLAVLSVTNGAADLDLTGSGQPASAADLAALGITTAERQQLAVLYAPGQQLWRIAVSHFTPWDASWPWDLPAANSIPDVPLPSAADSGKLDKPGVSVFGGTIETENQILHESLGITGSPLTLDYSGDRAPGRKAPYLLTIPLLGAAVPPGLARIDLEIDIAGQQVLQSFTPAPAQTTTFQWNGLDGYGAPVQGATTWNVKVGYVYTGEYQVPGMGDPSFGVVGGIGIQGSATRQQVTISRASVGQIGGLDARAAFGLGGWSLSVQHYFNPVDRTLYFGDGRRRSFGAQAAAPNVLTRVAGTGFYGSGGDGGPARNAQLAAPSGISLMSDGSLLIADTGNCRVRKVDPQGNISTVLGGVCPDPAQPQPPSATQLFFPTKAIEGPGGSIYVVDYGYSRVFRADANGFTTVAGTGVSGCTGDGNPAPSAQLATPIDIAFDRDGNLLITEANTGTACQDIRRVSPAGIISTVAPEFVPPGDPTAQPIVEPRGIAAGADGSIYFTQDHAVRRIPPDHKVDPTQPEWTLAGHDAYLLGFGFAGDGQPAAAFGATLLHRPANLALDRDRNLYFADQDNGRIRRISAADVINTIAGGGLSFTVTDGLLATDVALNAPYGVALDPTGQTLYISDSGTGIVWKMTTPLPFGDSTFSIASEDGSELYVFDAAGHHLRTESAVTGQSLLTFTYTAYNLPGVGSGQQQLLTKVQDAFGNVTTIERAADGTPLAIDAPFGQRTAVNLDGNGYLGSLVWTSPVPPTLERVDLTTSADGLLATLKDPKGAIYSFQYDGQGRLRQVQDPAQGSLTLNYQANANGGYSVGLQSALARTSSVQVTFLPTGETQKTATDTAGLVTTGVLKPDGSFTVTSPDRTKVEIDKQPDPRLGAQSPFVQTVTVTTPVNLLVYSQLRNRTVGVDPANPLNLLSQTDTVTVNNRTATIAYDAGQQKLTSTSPEGRQSVALYDSFGRLSQSQVPGFQPLNYAYDAQGRLQSVSEGTGTEQRTVTYTYNPQGFLDSATDPLQHVTRFLYDSVGRVTTTTLPDLSLIQTGYDLDGNLTSLTPPGQPAHGFSFDPVSDLSAYTPPAAVPGNPATIYTYNNDHQLVTVQRPDGQSVSFNYDNGQGSSGSTSTCSGSCASGRLLSVAMPQGTLALAYDPLTGKLTSLTSPDGQTLSYQYDGPLTTRLTAQGPAPGVIDLKYDTNFWVTTRTINGAAAGTAGQTQFTYDRDGLVTKAADVQVYRDAHNGTLTGAQLFGTGDVVTRSDLGEVQHYEVGYAAPSCTSGGQPPFSGCNRVLIEDYQRDHLGRITQATETTLDALTVSPVTHVYGYAYDTRGRLTGVTRDGAGAASYGYDGNGNRTSWTDAWGSGAATYDSQDRLLTYGHNAYTYTANGELQTKTQASGKITYTYDVLGNLRTVVLDTGVRIDYLVDALNRRIGKKVNGTLVQGFLYQGGIAPLAQLDASGNVVSFFTYASGRRVPEEMVQGSVVYRLMTDPLGSVRAVVNAQTGEIVQRLDYDAFGRVLLDTNPGFQPFGYAGGLYDYQTGLVRFGARDYDAETGRWTSKDPVGFGGGDTLLYGYVGNDPVNESDPQGLAEVDGCTHHSGDALPARCEGAINVVAADPGPLPGPGARPGDSTFGTQVFEQLGQTFTPVEPYVDLGLEIELTAFGGVPAEAGGAVVPSLFSAEVVGGVDHIVLGVERLGLRESAAAAGGRHLMDDPNFMNTVVAAAQNPYVKFTVVLDGLKGGTTLEQVEIAVRDGLAHGTTNSFTNWEIATLSRYGRLPGVTFMRAGQIVPNPF